MKKNVTDCELRPFYYVLAYILFELMLLGLLLVLASYSGKESTIFKGASACFLIITAVAAGWTGSKCYRFFGQAKAGENDRNSR